ncbi:MAG: pyridoxal-phosphate dependent enzyme [Ilumatobacteraceae bacterium]
MATRSSVAITRVILATLPTPLEYGGKLPGGATLLEYLCGEARDHNANCLVTVGAAQSNHCRMTAAAGACMGLDVHLVLSGETPTRLMGNQLLSHMFGATLHHTGIDSSDWGSLEKWRIDLTSRLEAEGYRPHSIPIGGSTPVGALGYVDAYDEILKQCNDRDFIPATILHTSSSGGTHAGLVAGNALARAASRPHPPVIAIGVAKGVALSIQSVRALAQESLALLGSAATIADSDVIIDDRYLGDGYAIPSTVGSTATQWAAHRGAWVLDPVYTAKGFAGLLGRDAEGEWSGSQHVVFIHTGGLPSVFA